MISRAVLRDQPEKSRCSRIRVLRAHHALAYWVRSVHINPLLRREIVGRFGLSLLPKIDGEFRIGDRSCVGEPCFQSTPRDPIFDRAADEEQLSARPMRNVDRQLSLPPKEKGGVENGRTSLGQSADPRAGPALYRFAAWKRASRAPGRRGRLVPSRPVPCGPGRRREARARERRVWRVALIYSRLRRAWSSPSRKPH